MTPRAMTAALVASGLFAATLLADDPRVLMEVGRDYPETRLFSACPVILKPGDSPLLAVAGFSQTGYGDVADLSVFEFREDAKPKLQWRLLRGGTEASSIRTLRAADLDGDRRDELIALGRVGDERANSRGELQVFRYGDEQWKPVALERWQSGQYTHGFGMDIADLDGDLRPEIITSGFFLKLKRETRTRGIASMEIGGIAPETDRINFMGRRIRAHAHQLSLRGRRYW